MLPKTRIFSALLLGIGVALIVWGLVAPRFVHADGRLPLDLEATTYTLTDDDGQTLLNSDPEAGLVTTPITRQLHFQVMDPADADRATLRVGDTLLHGVEGVDGNDQERLLSASVYNFRVDRFTGEILSEMAVTSQLASPTLNYEVEGIWLKFPTDAEATSYPVLDTTLRQARPADFVESTEVDGRTIMHYRQVIEKANVAESFADPSNTTTLTREDGGTTTGYLYHDVVRDFWVDQRTGLIVDMNERIDDFYGDRTGEKYDQVLLFDGSISDGQVSDLIAQAADIPVGESARTANTIGIIVGGVLALIGLAGSFGLFDRARRRRSRGTDRVSPQV